MYSVERYKNRTPTRSPAQHDCFPFDLLGLASCMNHTNPESSLTVSLHSLRDRQGGDARQLDASNSSSSLRMSCLPLEAVDLSRPRARGQGISFGRRRGSASAPPDPPNRPRAALAPGRLHSTLNVPRSSRGPRGGKGGGYAFITSRTSASFHCHGRTLAQSHRLFSRYKRWLEFILTAVFWPDGR
jgi:hypothetical protein